MEEKVNLSPKNTKKKVLIVISVLVVLFLGVNVFASTQGYNNIFFMIRNLFTNDEVIEKDEILSDRDITISYEYISIAEGLKIQINNLKIKNGEAELTTILKQNRMSAYDPSNFVVYDITGDKNIEVGSKHREKPESEKLPEGTVWIDSHEEYEDDEIIKLSGIGNETNKLKLEIKEANEEIIAVIEINLLERTIDVISSKATSLQQLSETELKSVLAQFAVLNVYKDTLTEDAEVAKEIQNYWKVYVAHELINEYVGKTTGNYDTFSDGFAVELTNFVIKEYLGENNTNALKIPENSFCYYNAENDGYKYRDGDGFVKALCIEIEDLTFKNGVYTATFIYCYQSDAKTIDIYDNIKNLAMYRTTMKFKLNEEYVYSKYCLVDADEIESEMIRQAINEVDNIPTVDTENENNEENSDNTIEEEKENTNTNTNTNSNNNTVLPTGRTDITNEDLINAAEKYILLNFYKDRDVHTEYYTDEQYRNEMKILAAFRLDFGHPSSPTQYRSIDKTIIYDIIKGFTGENFNDNTVFSQIIFKRNGNFFEYIGGSIHPLNANLLTVENIEEGNGKYKITFKYSYSMYPEDVYRGVMTLEDAKATGVASAYVKLKVDVNSIQSEKISGGASNNTGNNTAPTPTPTPTPSPNPESDTSKVDSAKIEELKKIVADYALMNYHYENINVPAGFPESMFRNEAKIMIALQLLTDGSESWNMVSFDKSLVHELIKAFSGEEIVGSHYSTVISAKEDKYGYASQFGPTYRVNIDNIESVEIVDGNYQVKYTYSYFGRVANYRGSMTLKPISVPGAAGEYVKYQIIGKVISEEI